MLRSLLAPVLALVLVGCGTAPTATDIAYRNCRKTSSTEWQWLALPPPNAEDLLRIASAGEFKEQGTIARHWFTNATGYIRLCRYTLDPNGRRDEPECEADTWTFLRSAGDWKNAPDSPMVRMCIVI